MALRRIKNLTIDRSKWSRGSMEKAELRGLQKVGRGLKDPVSGGMCCLGFLTEACGANVNHPEGGDLLLCYPPSQINDLYGLGPGTTPWSPFISQNDDEGPVCDKGREEILTHLFKEHLDINVKFVGETPRERKTTRHD